MEAEELIELYRQMVLIRRFEERTAQMYGMGKIGGFCHLYIGQEAVAVGAISALREDDYVMTAYRDHGHALAIGSDPKAVMAELFGRETGLCKGKGGSMHLFDEKHNFLGGYAIVGGQIPVAAGVGFAIKYRGGDQVVLCSFGEGAINQGAFHESLNLAALWKLPVIHLCENNRYGMGTAVERASAVWDITQRASSYNMDREEVDGMDVLAVRESIERAVKRAREESLPTLMEARTYRFRGHSMSDPIHSHYRSREEVEDQRERDPIALFRAKLEKDGVLSEETIGEIEEEVRALVAETVDFSNESHEPSLASLHEDVYV